MAASRAQLLRFLEKLSPRLRQAFLQAVTNSQTRINLRALTAAIEAGDVEAALRAAGIRSGSWTVLTEQVRNAYGEAGLFVMAADVPARYGMRFDINNPRAEEWLRRHSAQLVTGDLMVSQREAIQEALEAGMRFGRNPRTVALDIVGRVSPITGRRQGGIVGLTGPQSSYVINARQQLLELDSDYFTRRLRDKRFDNTIRKAIESGKPLPPAFRERVVAGYSDRLLKHRGDTIGRTEALNSLNAASDESLRQVIEEGLAPPEAVKRIWRHSFSPNERPGHRALSGKSVGINEPWVNPATGAVLMRPGDGPAAEVINCRCVVEHKIDFIAVELAA